MLEFLCVKVSLCKNSVRKNASVSRSFSVEKLFPECVAKGSRFTF